MSYSLLAIRLGISLPWLIFIQLCSFMAGMLFRTAQLKKAKKRVLSLENEMMKNHAEILKLQQKRTSSEKPAPEATAPVYPMKEQPNEEKPDRDVVTQQKKVN